MADNPDKQQNRKRRYLRAMCALEGGDYAGSAQAFEQNASTDDLCGLVSGYYAGEAHLRAGLEQMQERQFEAAAESFTRASRFNPNNRTLAQYLTCCFAQLGRFDRAVRHSDREVGLCGTECEPRIRLALSLWRDGQQTSALQTLREGLIAQPDQTEWHFQLSVLLASREEHANAIESLARALELDPQHTDALVHIGLCYGALSQSERAVQYLASAQRQRPHDKRIALLLSLATRAAEPDGEVADLQMKMPAMASSVQMGDIEELTRLIATEPEVVEAFVNLPQADSPGDVFEMLAAVIDRALLKRPRSAELHYHRARIYGRLGRRDLAIASCERAIEIDPQQIQALITSARLYLETDRHEDAHSRLQQVLDMGYEYADVYFHLGCIYRHRGQHHRARRSYHRALEINAGYSAAREALDSMAA